MLQTTLKEQGDKRRTFNLHLHTPNHVIAPDPEDPGRHWCPLSEKYTGGDALLNSLDLGWEITGIIFQQDFWHSGVRRVRVYHFTLRHDKNIVKMKVIENPWVSRLVETQTQVQVVLLNLRKDNGNEHW